MKIITIDEAKELLLNLKNSKTGHCVYVRYARVNPKCERCNKRYKEGFAKCPVCGDNLSFETNDIIRFNVVNPGEGITKPGEGVRRGKDFWQALEEDDCVKYYSFKRSDRSDGKKGAYRQFKLDNLIEMKLEGERYIIKRVVK